MKRYTKYIYQPSGFTLIELLIVIAIIGILASGLLIVLNPVRQIQKANDAKRKSDLGQVQKALEQYYNDNGKYPVSTSGYQITGVTWGSPWSNYMQTLPKDPSSSKNYVYVADSIQQTYWLYTSLDNTSDPQLCSSGSPCANATVNNVGASCGGTCNYGVSSSNTTP
jgi:type II secretion system protein G